ncbi:MAG: hypothetical protein COX70_09075 [Flavobacteriales bacterium CG_4_10_14_0_2_um_filter_32_8]|nr:MAG: hypothetical protein COX70_09075 [Flavobacteriales bacterium CG_4_10_14_0_2_um_filter_32_8]PJB13894.1 MAG: hypothetical protein CO118_11425 [Flavobacteriales bacterium CG_4_9_14_3_um_filter_32_8]
MMKYYKQQQYYKIKMNISTISFIMRKAILLSAIFFFIQLFSCKKDGELTPDFDNGNLSINFVDTFSLQTTVLAEDSLRTDLSIYNLLGLYNDPIFGPMSSSIYANVALSGASTDFGTSVVIDSVVLTLDYVELYGDTATPMSINVYELTAPLVTSTNYYSNTFTSYQSTSLASSTFIPNLKDSILTTVDSVMHKPHLRIKLTNSTFLTNLANGSPYADNTAFSSVFKGIYITTADSVGNTTLTPGAGSIASFDINSSLSTITVYYNNSLADSLQESFKINSETTKYSRFAHNYAGTDVLKHINNDPTKDTTVTYVSTMAGVKTKIEMPTIKELAKNGSIIINKAELVFTIANNTEGDFDEAISSLSLVGTNSAGETIFLPDFYEGLDYYGGTLVNGGSSKTYTFNISRHIQQLLYHSTTDYELYLLANGGSTTAKRSVISSEKNVISKIRLNITYSKL